ncbi:AP-3 complex subunit sigma-1 [Papilio xuthus]|uniref:AP-3 complex subunit sigma-1 n=2 Tax=Papilio xuthus TaxID=66420 RepID=A0A194PTJ5_PAPXU|nr:AP-3 complex subunit sigma-1 [Papilio xuthus]
MIKAILVFNNHGKPRLSKFYQYFNEDMQQQIIKETFQLVSKRDDNVCNFLEGGSLIGGSDYKLIYRHYATLYFVFCVDSSESELGILDLIQVFVETLDKCFENVCELDLIFHADAAHQVLDELVMGGMVLQTNMADILCRLQEQNKMQKAEAGISAAPARAVSAVKSMNLPQQLRDMKLPDLPQAIRQGAQTSPAGLATNILNTIYPHDKYHNLHHQDFPNKFFGSEALSTRFSESFSENYQQTEGINFPNYETHKSEGYQDLSGTVDSEYSEKKRKKKKRQGK